MTTEELIEEGRQLERDYWFNRIARQRKKEFSLSVIDIMNDIAYRSQKAKAKLKKQK